MDAARYLAGLNACFAGWGGEREYDLIFGRPFEGHLPERFVLTEAEEWLAGSAVSWRSLARPDGGSAPVGIMTGSWTLPAARGRGCFARVIQLSREACVRRGAALLLAFVTETNASRRQLERAGSLMIPARYMWSPEGATLNEAGGDELQPIQPSEEVVAACHARQAEQRTEQIRFHYPSPDLWRLQFIDRVLPTELLSHPELGVVVVERHPEFDRLLTAIPHRADQWIDLAAATWRRALRAGRRFFAYSTDQDRWQALTERCALGGVDGFVTVLPGGEEVGEVAAARWTIESGDRL